MDSSKIKLPGKYIISRGNNLGIKKEQVVTLDHIVKGNKNQDIYMGYYGVNSYHEVYTEKQYIRNFTEQEQADSDAGNYWKLPQQFYQTFLDSPEYNDVNSKF